MLEVPLLIELFKDDILRIRRAFLICYTDLQVLLSWADQDYL